MDRNEALKIVRYLLDEELSVDVRLINRKDGSIDVAVAGPRRLIKLGSVRKRGDKWKVHQVFHNVGRETLCNLDHYYQTPRAAASCLALASAPFWKADVMDQETPDELKEDEPTPDQIEAGNYKKGHKRWEGFDISVENRKGSKRSGTDPDGKEWSVTMPAAYGYFRRTEGKDGDHVDCYIGPDPSAQFVYIVDQIDTDSKKFDEHKCLINFADKRTAEATYKKGFSDGKGEARMGAVTRMTLDEFKEWLKDGDTTKPLAYGKKSVRESEADDLKGFVMHNPPTSSDVFSAEGKPIRRSRNLRGIRNHVAKNIVNRVNIYPLSDGAVLEITFENGDYYRGRFASYGALKWAVRNWRNLYGAPLFINGVPAGQIRFNNRKLAESAENDRETFEQRHAKSQTISP